MALIQRVLRSLDERSEATNLGLVSFDSGRVDLPLEREVLLMESDLLRPWLVTMVELAHDELTVVPTPRPLVRGQDALVACIPRASEAYDR